MKMLIFITFVLGWSNTSLGQGTYEKVYLAGGYGHLIELTSRNILTGFCYSVSGNATGITLIEPEGNVIHTHCRAIDTMLVLIGLKKYSDNEFFFTSAYLKDTCLINGNSVIPHIYPVIGRMDSLGEILSARYYTSSTSLCASLVGDLEVTADGSVITWGNSLALKVDSTGQPLWSKWFSADVGFRFIKELPSGDLLAGINMDNAGAVVARLDAQGNFIWCKSYVRPLGVLQDAVIESDSSFIVTGFTETSSANLLSPLPPDFHPTLFMLKLDGTGDVQWCKGYDSAPNNWHTPKGSQFIKARDGKYALIATLGHPGYNQFSRSFLMKTDLNGDTLWTRSIGAPGYDHYAQELLASADGGYVISGGIRGNLPMMQSSLPSIYKTDSLGHLPCSEQSSALVVLDLFPVDSSLVLSSLEGVLSYPASVRESEFSAIVEFDACIITTTPNSIDVRRFLVRPNPNTGRFTVEFEDPLEAESYYSVYDAMGKLLFQRPLPIGKQTEQIDLSRHGAGTYLIKFTNPDGVCHERVVVE